MPPQFEAKEAPKPEEKTPSLFSHNSKSKAAMEAILTDCVQSSLRHFIYPNAIFLCERLCAEFPSEVLHIYAKPLFCVCLFVEKQEETYSFRASIFRVFYNFYIFLGDQIKLYC